MALEITGLERKFKLNSRGKDVVLSDLNPDASPEDIMRLYCDTYPELASATVNGPDITNDGVYYSFTTKAGLKG